MPFENDRRPCEEVVVAHCSGHLLYSYPPSSTMNMTDASKPSSTINLICNQVNSQKQQHYKERRRVSSLSTTSTSADHTRQCLLLLALLFICTTALNSLDENFMTENRAKTGVVELPSGLQYKVLVQGEGSFHPQPLCQCLVHYEGKLLDGHVFDSSFERGEPLRVSPSQVIDG